jgi:hypothetical protein
VSSEGELEPEVDDNKVITDEDRAAALELKARANKAFAGECRGAAWLSNDRMAGDAATVQVGPGRIGAARRLGDRDGATCDPWTATDWAAYH